MLGILKRNYRGPDDNAWFKSARRSSIFSIPTEIRTRSSVKPRASRTEAGIAACVMKQGMLMRDFTLPDKTKLITSSALFRETSTTLTCQLLNAFSMRLYMKSFHLSYSANIQPRIRKCQTSNDGLLENNMISRETNFAFWLTRSMSQTIDCLEL